MDALQELVMGKPIWMWALFMSIVLALLVLDLGLFHRKTREIGHGAVLETVLQCLHAVARSEEQLGERRYRGRAQGERF